MYEGEGLLGIIGQAKCFIRGLVHDSVDGLGDTSLLGM
jgi:hypothetical protein